MGDPIDWMSWIYGKVFLGHPVRGGIIICGLGAILFTGLLVILYARGLEKWNKENPVIPTSPPAPATTQPTAPKPVGQTSTQNQLTANTPTLAPPATARSKTTSAQHVDPQENEKNRKFETRDQLGKLLIIYQDIKRTCAPSNIGPVGSGAGHTPEDCQRRWAAWNRRVLDYAHQNMERADYARLEAANGNEERREAIEKLIDAYR